LSNLLQLRLRSGRPHWIVVDEAHHMLAPSAPAHASELSKHFDGLVFVTVHPDQLAPAAVTTVKLVMAVGEAPQERVQMFARHIGHPPPRLPEAGASPHSALVWNVDSSVAAFVPRPEPQGERRRHIRKYAEGQLGEDKSFYFRGTDNRLNLRAHNLAMFIQIAEGVDDETWLHHLREKDYSRWFRNAIKDNELAREVEEAEADLASGASVSRERILSAVEKRYTAPASNS
jgi:hypothetical protein